MNSLEARFLLEACRAGDLDESDPRISEAVKAMESDPQLSEWFARSQEWDHAVSVKLKAVPVPPDLADRIRAGSPAVATRPTRRPGRRWLALAAAVAILGALLMLRSSPVDQVTFRHDMADFMDRRWDHTFDVTDPDFARVRQWLESRKDSIQIDVPLPLAASRTIGCRTFRWRGSTATLICFTPASAGSIVHVLIVDRNLLTEAPGGHPAHAVVGHWNSAIWSQGDKVYLALTLADPDKLAGCL